MNVKDFCQIYGLTKSAVYDRIKKNENGALDGHIIRRKGEAIELDDAAVEFLRPKPERFLKHNETVLKNTEHNIVDISKFITKRIAEYDEKIEALNDKISDTDLYIDALRDIRISGIEEQLQYLANAVTVLICKVYGISEIPTDISTSQIGSEVTDSGAE